MKIKFLVAACFLTCSAGYSQTMKIAHRSHSGSNNSFTIHTTEGNFGETPEMIKKRKEAEQIMNDSLARKASDSIARVNAANLRKEEIARKAVVDSLANLKSKIKKKKKKKGY